MTRMQIAEWWNAMGSIKRARLIGGKDRSLPKFAQLNVRQMKRAISAFAALTHANLEAYKQAIRKAA